MIGEARVKLAAKAGDAFGYEHIVDAVLHVGVLVPDMEAPRTFRILTDTRKPKHQLAEWNIVPLGQILDFLPTYCINRRSQAGHDFLASLIQLTDDRDFGHLHRLIRDCGSWGWPRQGLGLGTSANRRSRRSQKKSCGGALKEKGRIGASRLHKQTG